MGFLTARFEPNLAKIVLEGKRKNPRLVVLKFRGGYLNLSELIRAYLNLSELIGVYRSLSELIRVYRNLSEFIGTYQIDSDWFRPVIPNALPLNATHPTQLRTTPPRTAA